MNFKNLDWQHGVMAILSPMATALVVYLGSKDPGSLIEALGSWRTAKPMLFGALVAELTTLLALAKQSFNQPANVAANGGGK